jgi:hypothetical protein
MRLEPDLRCVRGLLGGVRVFLFSIAVGGGGGGGRV